MVLRFNDGGKAAAGMDGIKNDCAIRAVAIASGRDYLSVFRDLAQIFPANIHEGVEVTSAKFMSYMRDMGFVFIPSIDPGERLTQFPDVGRFVVLVKGHATAIVNGLIEDVVNAQGEPLIGYYTYNPKGLHYVYYVDPNSQIDEYMPTQRVTVGLLSTTAALEVRRLHLINYRRKVYVV